MTFDDLTGQEFDHPQYGSLMVIEYNHAGQVFCYDARGRYVILEGGDPALEGMDLYDATEEEIELVDMGEIFLSDPDARGILIMVTETNDLVVKAKNLEVEEGKQIIRQLDDIFSAPHEQRYIAN